MGCMPAADKINVAADEVADFGGPVIMLYL